MSFASTLSPWGVQVRIGEEIPPGGPSFIGVVRLVVCDDFPWSFSCCWTRVVVVQRGLGQVRAVVLRIP